MNFDTETGLDATQLLDHAHELLVLRDLPAANNAFHRAEALGAPCDPCSGGRWSTAMLAGNFEAAWHECDTLRQRNAPDPHRLWTGEAVAGKHIVVRALHGFGDAVQMLRYAPLLQQMAASVIYELPPRLIDIAPYFTGVTNIITWGEQAPTKPPSWDLQIEIMELPYLFRSAANDLPSATRYINLPLDCLDQAADVMRESGEPRIGLVWAAGEWNPGRSIPLELFRPLLNDSRYSLWNLQGGPANEASNTPMHNANVLCGDGILPLAHTIARLDLVITVDTLAAHLAGALGKPVWLLIQHAADWRWMTDRMDSPWYPSMRLFRQPTPGDWSSVVTNVLGALEARVD